MFRKTYIEITNVCNLGCTFCSGTSRTPAYMEPALFQRILDQLHGVSRLLHFHVLGEPLLHPDVGSFLEMAQIGEFLVNLVTNGTLLEQRQEELLGKPALRQISISLQSMPQEDEIVGEQMESIYRFHKESRRRGGPPLCLRMWGFEERCVRLKLFLEAISKVFGVTCPAPHDLRERTGARLSPLLTLSTAPRFSWPNISGPDYGVSGYCLGLKEQFAVLVDGTVVPCCLDSNGNVALGNVKHETIRDILSSERSERIRAGFREGLITEELCHRCSFRLRFSQNVGTKESRRTPSKRQS